MVGRPQRPPSLRQESIRAVQARVRALEPPHVTVGNKGRGDCFFLAVLQQLLPRFLISGATVAPEPPTVVEVSDARHLIAWRCARHPDAAMLTEAHGGLGRKKGSLQEFLEATRLSGTHVSGELELCALAEQYGAIVTVITDYGEKVWYPRDGRSKMVIRLAYYRYKKGNEDGHYEAVVPEYHAAALQSASSIGSAVPKFAPSLQIADTSGSRNECYICRQDDPEPMQKGCECKGSTGAVHLSCLQECAARMPAAGMTRWMLCSTCKKTPYGPAHRMLAADWLIDLGSRERTPGQYVDLSEREIAEKNLTNAYKFYESWLLEQEAMQRELDREAVQRELDREATRKRACEEPVGDGTHTAPAKLPRASRCVQRAPEEQPSAPAEDVLEQRPAVLNLPADVLTEWSGFVPGSHTKQNCQRGGVRYLIALRIHTADGRRVEVYYDWHQNKLHSRQMHNMHLSVAAFKGLELPKKGLKFHVDRSAGPGGQVLLSIVPPAALELEVMGVYDARKKCIVVQPLAVVAKKARRK